MKGAIDVVRSVVRPDANVGPAAPASNGKQPLGNAAPASDGDAAGNPSSPSSGDAVVAAKKQAEHWRNKYERDVGALRETVSTLAAKFDGLAQGLNVNAPTAQAASKPMARAFQDLDDNSIDEVVKKGIEEGNPSFITASVREIVQRQAAATAEQARKEAKAQLEHVMAQQQVAARISSEFGAAVMDEDSELRQRADNYAARALRADPDIMNKIPDFLYHCFASADRDLRAGEKVELETFRTAKAEREAREEFERSKSALMIKARNDVAEKLGQKDIKGAISARLPWLKNKG